MYAVDEQKNRNNFVDLPYKFIPAVSKLEESYLKSDDNTEL